MYRIYKKISVSYTYRWAEVFHSSSHFPLGFGGFFITRRAFVGSGSRSPINMERLLTQGAETPIKNTHDPSVYPSWCKAI